MHKGPRPLRAPPTPSGAAGFSYLEKEFPGEDSASSVTGSGWDDESERSFGDPVGGGGRTRRRLSEHVECAGDEVPIPPALPPSPTLSHTASPPPPPTHTQTRTHARTRTHTHTKQTHTRNLRFPRTRIHTHARPRTHSRAHTHTRARARARSLAPVFNPALHVPDYIPPATAS